MLQVLKWFLKTEFYYCYNLCTAVYCDACTNILTLKSKTPFAKKKKNISAHNYLSDQQSNHIIDCNNNYLINNY